uniref:ATP synthase F0 subunit 8 n=1 Tax=Myrianida brachycephala TaxID=884646 RepID=A0A1C9UZD6_MYRBC|nr:ATP synthase F0 subunit 8 [Myrianida brachycephala]AOR87128.1 ATP synthase F0 subunit 8 [Myrianida brachycephala]
MPHLSPMPWLLIPIFFWLYLMSIAIMMWFTPATPRFPYNLTQQPLSFSTWMWL